MGIHHLCYEAFELVPHTDTQASAAPGNAFRIKAPSEPGYGRETGTPEGPSSDGGVLLPGDVTASGKSTSLFGIELPLKICTSKLLTAIVTVRKQRVRPGV